MWYLGFLGNAILNMSYADATAKSQKKALLFWIHTLLWNYDCCLQTHNFVDLMEAEVSL